MIKTLNKADTEKVYLNIVKATYDKLTTNIIFTGKRLKPFPLRSGIRRGCPFSPIQYSTGSPSQSNQARKKNTSELERRK